MTSFAEQAAIASRSDTINTQLGVFRGMAGNLAEVNVNGATVRVPCDGFTPPIPGMSVRVQWVNGSPSVTGPARPLNPRGVITGAGSPRATVTVEGQPYLMYLAAGYTPAVGDVVSIRWDYEGGLITGKVQGYETPKPPEPVPPPPQSFTDLVVRAENSGRFQSGVGWWGNDPWASSNNNGLWTYGNRVKDALAGASNLVADIYLPLVRELSGGQLLFTSIQPFQAAHQRSRTLGTRRHITAGCGCRTGGRTSLPLVAVALVSRTAVTRSGGELL